MSKATNTKRRSENLHVRMHVTFRTMTFDTLCTKEMAAFVPVVYPKFENAQLLRSGSINIISSPLEKVWSLHYHWPSASVICGYAAAAVVASNTFLCDDDDDNNYYYY